MTTQEQPTEAVRIRPDEDLRWVPPAELIAQPEIRAALRAFQDAKRAASAARAEFARLRRQRSSVLQREGEALADARAAGRTYTTGVMLAKHDRATDTAKIGVLAAEEIQRRAHRAFLEALRDHGDEWRKLVDQEVADAAERSKVALDQLRGALSDLERARGLAAYTAGRTRMFQATSQYGASLDAIAELIEPKSKRPVPMPVLRA